MTDADSAGEPLHDRVKIGLVSVSDRASAGVYEDLGLPALRDWLAESGGGTKVDMYDAPFTREMAAQAGAYYFHHYAVHFSAGALGRALAGVPALMSWDDHDVSEERGRPAGRRVRLFVC